MRGRCIQALRDVTPEWLTLVLSRNGLLTGGQVQKVLRRPLNYLATSGAVFRLTLTYSQDAQGTLPPTLVLKLPGTGEETRAFARTGAYYYREVFFYERISLHLQAITPRCYDFAYNPESDDFHLLLEDCQAGYLQYGWEMGPGLTAMLQVMEWFAALHAQWWGQKEFLSSLSTVPPPHPLPEGEQLQEALSTFFALGDDRLSERERSLCEAVARHWHELGRQTSGHLTLRLGDALPLNMFFPEQSGGRLLIVDWQSWEVGSGLADLADFLGLYIHPGSRRQWEQDMVRHYWEALRANGIKAYSWSDCWHDYRVETARNLLTPLIIQNIPNLPRGGVLLRFKNAMLAFDDLGVSHLIGR